MDPDQNNNGAMPAADDQGQAPVADDQGGQAPVADDNGAANNEEAPAMGGEMPAETPAAEETPATEEPAA